jgi:hypothetical protein
MSYPLAKCKGIVVFLDQECEFTENTDFFFFCYYTVLTR